MAEIGPTVLIDSVIMIDHFNGVAAATEYLLQMQGKLAISVITRAEDIVRSRGGGRIRRNTADWVWDYRWNGFKRPENAAMKAIAMIKWPARYSAVDIERTMRSKKMTRRCGGTPSASFGQLPRARTRIPSSKTVAEPETHGETQRTP